MHMTASLSRFGRFTLRFAHSTNGLALTEFAYAAPMFALLGLSGLELSNYALAHLRVNQVASSIADVLSRSGESDGLGKKALRESDINDAFQAVSRQSGNLDLATRGRIIVSGLEQNASGGQWIRWQRCFGSKTTYVSDYGVTDTGKTGTAFAGMGPTGAKAAAPDNASAVMYAEVKYDYKPLIAFKNIAAANSLITARAAFLVRDRRDLSSGNDPKAVSGVTASTC
jgi:hypothetical protein